MTKIDVFSGFLGAGKTTLIKKLISEAYIGEKIVLIENEFGEIGIDGGFMKDAGIEVNEMNSGCICCSLVGDFTQSLKQVLEQFSPDRILIEPSGVGKLSDVIKAVQKVESDGVKLNAFTTVADAGKCCIYAKNFGEFYNDQIANAGTIVLSRTDKTQTERLSEVLDYLKEQNPTAHIATSPWDTLDGKQILEFMEHGDRIREQLIHEIEEEHNHEHHHHHDGEECHCHDHKHEHHHHDGEECHCHEHEHEHHHHHHHADEVFDSWGIETVKSYTVETINAALNKLDDEHMYGAVLRAKGIVPGVDGQWIHFDYVPGEPDVRIGCADVIGRLCVIGSGIQKEALAALFGIKTEGN